MNQQTSRGSETTQRRQADCESRRLPVRSVRDLVPTAMRSVVIRLRDQWRLARQDAVPCDASRLAPLELASLHAFFADATIDEEWPQVLEEVELFEIATSAGGVNLGDRRALYYLVRALRPARVLEIGTHIGASTIHIAAALRRNAALDGPAPDLTTVDVIDVNDAAIRQWERYGSLWAPGAMIERLGLSGGVRFVNRSSLDFLADAGPRYDLIFLDGDHRAATVYRELPAALRRTAPGGVVVLHDYFPDGRPLWPRDLVIPGPWLAVERLRREGAPLRVLPFGRLRWPTKLGRTVTSLAAVVKG
jgi:predicted O-methyltransferase YrrM